jgi:protein-tyrosine phosphatase
MRYNSCFQLMDEPCMIANMTTRPNDRSPSGAPVRVLFVCLGNICRSPLAEGVFRHLVREHALEEHFHIDSAGTGAWHVGEPPDPRSREVAERHGVGLDGQRARQVRDQDFAEFDYIVAMDRQNLKALERLRVRSGGEAEVLLLRDHDPAPGDGEVPDPYYGGPRGFDDVFEMIRRSAAEFLRHLSD